MRKYFLLSAVALLATSTANATTDYAEVTAKATIEVATKFSCDNIDYGTIVVKQNNASFVIDAELGVVDDTNSLISWSGDWGITGVSTCSITFDDDFDENVTLKNNNGDNITLNVYNRLGDPFLISTLTIPAQVKPGEYTGSFTVTVTSE